MILLYVKKNPIEVEIASWLNTYQGRFSIGKKKNHNNAYIYAYTDNDDKIAVLGKIARKEHLDTFRSVSMKGATCFEEG